MAFEHGLKPMETVDNRRLCEIFKCAPQGGIRKSNLTNTLTIISMQCGGVYDDKWDHNILHYTGMGLNGDQDINYGQNRTIKESRTNGIEMFLFEVWQKGEYVYRGRVVLAGKPYESKQLDEQENMRKVWMFPLKLVEEDSAVDGDIIYRQDEIKRKKVKRISDEYLVKVADSIQGKPRN